MEQHTVIPASVVDRQIESNRAQKDCVASYVCGWIFLKSPTFTCLESSLAADVLKTTKIWVDNIINVISS